MESKTTLEQDARQQASELASARGGRGQATGSRSVQDADGQALSLAPDESHRARARETSAPARRPPRKARRSRVPTGRRTLQQQIGQRAEDIAADFLRENGLRIVERNFRRRLGELDIVALDGDVLVVAEVRYRASNRYGGAAASVDGRKQQRLIRAAAQLLQRSHVFSHFRIRFDVICVSETGAATPRVEWFQHAFLT